LPASNRDVYSHGHSDAVLRSHRWRTAENSAGYLLPRLRPTDTLLDVGFGPGTITLDLASRLSAGRVVGVENAPEAIEAARREAGRANLSSVEFLPGDVYDLEFSSGTFDVVHAHQVLQHLSDPVAALVEMARVCKPGGIVAARDADYSAMAWYPENAGLTRWLSLYRQVARSNSGEPDAGRRLRSWALRAGCVDVESTGSVWCFADDHDVSWWSDTWAERLTGSAFGQQALERGFAEPQELEDLAAQWRKWGEAPDAWFSIVHGEILCTVKGRSAGY
jgi:SAM-dependent methyltransferase